MSIFAAAATSSPSHIHRFDNPFLQGACAIPFLGSVIYGVATAALNAVAYSESSLEEQRKKCLAVKKPYHVAGAIGKLLALTLMVALAVFGMISPLSAGICGAFLLASLIKVGYNAYKDYQLAKQISSN